MSRQSWAYQRAGKVRAALLSLVLGISIFGVTVADAATPRIAFLNPSGFSLAGERGIIVSDAVPDAGRGCCSSSSRSYRLSAWISDAPADARVYFGIKQGALEREILAAPVSGTETWETEWSVPREILDGPATVNAYLVVNGAAVASAKQDVTILRVQERAEITYPMPGGSLGFYRALATSMPDGGRSGSLQAPKGVIDASYTSTPDVSHIRSFYTTSVPGSVPEWTPCGTEVVGGGNPPRNRADDGVRCVLKDPSHFAAITAVASVANDSPDAYDPRFNQAGDAVPVGSTYLQEPRALRLITDGLEVVEPSPLDETEFFCSPSIEAQLTDQIGRTIAGANVDVHAWGPDDRLSFHTSALTPVNQVPDRATHSQQEAYDCGLTPGPSANSDPGNQGRHLRFGLPDHKHVEALAMGTTDDGRFIFRLHTETQGTTRYLIWVDETDNGCVVNDDAYTTGELSISGVVTWGASTAIDAHETESIAPCSGIQPSPSPTATGTPEPSPSASETIEPSPSPSDPPDPDGNRSITLRIAGDPEVGGQAVFKGRISASELACRAQQKVLLKIRRPGGSFYTRQWTMSSSDGRFEMRQRIRAPRHYKVVTKASGFCVRAASDVIKIRRM